MVTILIKSVKMATLGLLKTKIFRTKRYNVVISVYETTNRISSRDPNYIVDMIMCPKL